MAKPIIYSTPECVYCHALMDWLDSKNIDYEEKDITDPAVEDEISRIMGYRISTVPTTLVGEEVVVGFNRPALQKALMRADAAEKTARIDATEKDAGAAGKDVQVGVAEENG